MRFSLFLILPMLLLTSCTLASVTLEVPGTATGMTTTQTTVDASGLTLIDIGSTSNEHTATESGFVFYADYPVYSGSHISDSIALWLEEQIHQTETESSGITLSELDQRPEFFSSYETVTSNGVTTVMYDVYRYTGGAHSEESIQAFPMDAHGKRVTFSDVFTTYDTGSIRKTLIDMALASPENLGVDLISEGVDDYLANPEFYLSGGVLHTVFARYQIAPGAVGSVDLIFSDPSRVKSMITGSADYPSIPPSESSLSQAKDTGDLIDQALAAESAKYIALTFDDGPSKSQTPRLLEILRKNNVHATFFVLGKNSTAFPDVVKSEYTAGHEIATHSWDHPLLTRLSITDLDKQKNKTDAIIKQITGSTPALFRPPYGAYNNLVKSTFARPIILWSVDTLDWKYRNVTHDVQVATTDSRDGSIILFHDIHATSVDSIDTIIKDLKSRGYTFVTSSELLRLKNGGKAVTGTVVCTAGWKCK